MAKRNLPQTYGEMVADNTEKKSNRLYRAESSDFVDGKLTQLVGATATELAAIADNAEAVNLNDASTLKERTILYCRACADSSTIPTFSGFARSCGLSTQGMNEFMRKHPDSESSEWLRIAHDAFADCLAEAAQRNMVNSIVSIFALKARSGWKETVALEAVQHDPMGQTTEQSQLATDYAAYVTEVTED